MHLELLSMLSASLVMEGQGAPNRVFTCSAARESRIWPQADNSISQDAYQSSVFCPVMFQDPVHTAFSCV